MTSADRTRPRLTVFTPFYRNIDYFDECIASVLAQSFRDFEYLMINDGDPENARRIERVFADPRIRIINTTHPLGLSGSRNFGLQQAQGDLIAFIDSDDFCEPGRLEKQFAFLAGHPDHVLVGTNLRYINERSETIGGRKYPENDAEIKKRLITVNCIAQPSVMARREALIEAGGYTEDFPCAEDYALWLRLARLGKYHNLQEPLVAYRIHEQSGKHLLLKPALRDTMRLKIHAIRHYGFKPTPSAIASIVLHAVLRLLPARLIFWLFKRLVVVG
jgi:cellulose synthase/poly-beta-1,6-N-acetylglucosamine synthase-like glycosyltransferase